MSVLKIFLKEINSQVYVKGVVFCVVNMENTRCLGWFRKLQFKSTLQTVLQYKLKVELICRLLFLVVFILGSCSRMMDFF